MHFILSDYRPSPLTMTLYISFSSKALGGDLEEGEPFIVPALVSNDRVNIGLFHKLSALGGQVNVSISFRDQLSLVVESTHCDYYFRPT
jgi:hypothetical protein